MNSPVMQPTRRRKKRPNYGIRTVEVCRGINGFGFTISGQQPCIMSCIVPNSPAERAGLRPGDYLIAVCGQNVSKTLHDDVVQLIGNVHGILKLQIAENYYSDSSEEDFIATIRPKPKYPYKHKNNGHSTHPFMHNKSQKFIGIGEDHLFEDKFDMVKSAANDNGIFPHKSCEAISLSPQNHIDVENEVMALETDRIFQCIVGYLGTIEMPKKLTPVSRQQIVRGCIKRLRTEKRNYSPVMMTIFPCSLRLKNDVGITIAVYPGGRVTFCSACNEQNRKYFGLVTTSVSDEPSNSCHVFIVLNVAHQEHSKLASRFGLNCSTASLNSTECSHFPSNCDAIVNAIRRYYEDRRNDNNLEEPLVANSPQPSNDSSVTTSNSDSGIGFRDESGNQSDRILVVDIQNQRLHIQAAGLADPQYVDCCAEKSDKSSTATSSSIIVQSKHNFNEFSNDIESSAADKIYHWDSKPAYKSGASSNTRLSCKSFEDLSAPAVASVIVDGSLERRLSPKVFAHISDVAPVSHSLEDLKTQSELYEDMEPANSFMKKHSLQDLTVFSTDAASRSQPSNEPVESERKVTSWATSLEKLLNDSVGLHAFAEFLKKEFSVENAYFWAACEKYRSTVCFEERRQMGQRIYDKFLSNTATEPVNVDSSGKNLTQQQLQNADISLLQNAQKQIYNLMKFDSYPRFLKSDLYKNYLMREMNGDRITLSSDMVDLDLLFVENVQKAKNAKECTDEADRNHRSSRRRRSLLPWTRSRCKSKDRTVASTENVSSCSGSYTSLASWDIVLPVTLCRVVLPDSSSAVLNIQSQETVHHLIGKLLEKRAMPYNSFQVIFAATDKPVVLEESATVLSGKEVRIEWRIEFRLDLPDRKSLTVKSKPSHTLGAVLGPILSKYGYNLQLVTLCLMSENEVLEPSTIVSAVDKQRIQVLTRSTPTPNLQGWNYYDCNAKSTRQPATLDEITNRVFEELLQGKAENYRNPVVENVPSERSDDWSSEHSSKILGKFLRKDSFHQDKHKRGKKCPEEQINLEKRTGNRLAPVAAMWKPTSRVDARLDKDSLFEGLRRCQRGRLEDQRGTEINVELPDFLKDKENTPCGRKKLKKIRKDVCIESRAIEKEPKDIACAMNKNSTDNNSTITTAGGKITDPYQTTDFLSGDYGHDDESDGNIYANDAINFGCTTSCPSPSVFKEPPPLPPKPKNITWRFSSGANYHNIGSNGTNTYDPTPKSIYLERPTSSFV